MFSDISDFTKNGSLFQKWWNTCYPLWNSIKSFESLHASRHLRLMHFFRYLTTFSEWNQITTQGANFQMNWLKLFHFKPATFILWFSWAGLRSIRFNVKTTTCTANSSCQISLLFIGNNFSDIQLKTVIIYKMHTDFQHYDKSSTHIIRELKIRDKVVYSFLIEWYTLTIEMGG